MKVGQLFGIGISGTALTDDEAAILERYSPYAVILFARNVESDSQLRALVAEIKARTDPPALVLIDEEGDRVDRIRKLIPGIPGPADCSASGDPAASAFELGQWIGNALRWFDIDVNLAPVVDVESGATPRGLERRCWGRTPEEVTDLAREFIRGQDLSGIGSCLKHFPGMGRGTDDPHLGSSVITAAHETIEESDLMPFAELGDLAGAVMIGHCTYTEIDPDHPASLSPKIATVLLRERGGFEGLTFSDDMDMHAVSDLDESDVIAESALLAGNDVLLFCTRPERLDGMVARFEQRIDRDEEFRSRVERSIDRGADYRRHLERLKSGATATEEIDTIREALVGLRDVLGLTG